MNDQQKQSLSRITAKLGDYIKMLPASVQYAVTVETQADINSIEAGLAAPKADE